MSVIRRGLVVVLTALAVACSVEANPGASPAAFPPPDDLAPAPSGEPDARANEPTDEEPPPDAGPSDAGPGEILGALEGSCGIVKTLLTTKSPTFEQNALSFTAGEHYDKASLSPDGQRLFDTDNAGGSSSESEVMSFEVLHACEGAALLKTETEIAYTPPDDAGPSSITDILVEIAGKKVGVSVTRAYRPKGQPFPDADVKALLQKKLEGVNRSSVRVTPADRWVKQILHVFASTEDQADAVARVLPTIDAAIRADTVVLLTRTVGGGFVYCNPDPPLGSECP